MLIKVIYRDGDFFSQILNFNFTKMKKTILQSVFTAFLFSIICFQGCSNDTIVNTPVQSTKGIFVLYEGQFGQPSSYDYAFINLLDSTVKTNVYQNSNNGALLNAFPDGMMILGTDLYITAQGGFASQGTIYKINSSDNHLTGSANFGKNPYSMVIDNNKIYVTNTSGSYVTVMDMNFNILDTVGVGLNPADVVQASGKIYVSKQSYTSENSIAIINESNNQVSKIFFQNPPVSVAANSGKVFVSVYGSKTMYIIDQVSNQVTDSVSIGTQFFGIGDLRTGDSRTIYAVGADTSFFQSVGKEIYKYDIINKSSSKIIPYPGSNTNIYGLSFDAVGNKLYIADAKTGTTNGEVRVYDSGGALLKTYADIGGKFPKRFAFKY